MNQFDHYYNNQARGLPYFAGPSYQRGHGLGGIFGSIFRAVTPLLRSAAPIAKRVARNIGKQAAVAGANVLTDVAAGVPIAESAKKRSRDASAKLVKRGRKELIKMLNTPKRKSIKRRRTRHRDIFSK
jgi:hypothetical protein